ncbi:hypothetical protein RFI_05026 [Reticulomyxa filosa]|uniref:Uncharacterized protein n=1 Tax=Reticulomyxa filosa TaxID=46433 RepID=X6P3E8_RETFI|nr:hypothetical protein RFI_05026 [Reticulomyxa filosa]|eukprot:ETO32092.1 hypothetical protein RFI_05026 [Reticulomyxa filosa]
MTAFDLIGIVSTQMLSNVFTRSLQEERPTKTYTQFATAASPAKILWAIEQSVDQMDGCTSSVETDRYELLVTKKCAKKSSIVLINIKIFHSPTGEYIVQCRRQSVENIQLTDIMIWLVLFTKKKKNNLLTNFLFVMQQMTIESPKELVQDQSDTWHKNSDEKKDHSPLLKPYLNIAPGPHNSSKHKPKKRKKNKNIHSPKKQVPGNHHGNIVLKHMRSTSDGIVLDDFGEENSYSDIEAAQKAIKSGQFSAPSSMRDLGAGTNTCDFFLSRLIMDKLLFVYNNRLNPAATLFTNVRNKYSESDENVHGHAHNISNVSMGSVVSITSSASSGNELSPLPSSIANVIAPQGSSSMSQLRSRTSTQESVDSYGAPESAENGPEYVSSKDQHSTVNHLTTNENEATTNVVSTNTNKHLSVPDV